MTVVENAPLLFSKMKRTVIIWIDWEKDDSSYLSIQKRNLRKKSANLKQIEIPLLNVYIAILCAQIIRFIILLIESNTTFLFYVGGSNRCFGYKYFTSYCREQRD